MADYGEGHRARCLRIADEVRDRTGLRLFAMSWTDGSHVIGRLLVGRRFQYVTVPMTTDEEVVTALVDWCHATATDSSFG